MVYISNPNADLHEYTSKQQQKVHRKQVSKLARTIFWSQRIFLACVMLITTYNVALAICDTININYTLWLSSTTASIAFCVICAIAILFLYLNLKSKTKSLSKSPKA